MAFYSLDQLCDHLRGMGLAQGDAVLVRAAAKLIGEVDGRSPKVLLDALQRVVGPEGTIFGLTFTKSFLFPRRHKEYIYDGGNPPITGGFARAVLGAEGAVRSLHPTNSWTGVGADAVAILEDHDERATCFAPLEKMMGLNGKMMLVGCLTSSPGFSTVHLAQAHLGLNRKSLMGPISGVHFQRDGETKVFTKWDTAGCSRGFGKFYSDYLMADKLIVGKVGDATSLAIGVADAYAIERRILEKNPRYPLCAEKDCLYCRGSLRYNLRDIPGYFLRQAAIKLVRRAVPSRIES